MDIYSAFVFFAIVMTGSPGAGNLTMMGIGQTTGFRSALPFLGGATVGMVALNTLVGLGVGSLFMASPHFAWLMKGCGMGYICYLGWKLLFMQLAEGGGGKRLTFLEGVVLHPMNPKSWAMSVVGFSQIADSSLSLLQQMGVFVSTFLFFQVFFHSLWGGRRNRSSANLQIKGNTHLSQFAACCRDDRSHRLRPVPQPCLADRCCIRTV